MQVKRLVGILIALFGNVALRSLTNEHDADDMQSHAVKWLPAAVVAAYTYIVEGEDNASLGIRWDGLRPFAKRAAVGLGVMLGANVLLEPLHDRLGVEEMKTGMGEFSDTSTVERLFIALTAGVTEELMFRGYALERLETETGSRVAAAATSTLAFVLAHKGEQWSWRSLLLIAQPATLVTLFYLRTRDLLAAITIHAINDFVGLLLLERFTEEE